MTKISEKITIQKSICHNCKYIAYENSKSIYFCARTGRDLHAIKNKSGLFPFPTKKSCPSPILPESKENLERNNI